MAVAPHIEKILFTTDLSKETKHAFIYAVGLAFQYGASLIILYVMEDAQEVRSQNMKDFLGSERWAEVRQSHEQEIRKVLIGKQREGQLIRSALAGMLSAAQKDLGADRPGVSDQIVITQGDVADCILQEIQAHGIDLVVMGYHARGRLEEAIAGSVSRSVLRKVHVPVLLVKLP
jgi:nucleotide-binding universal stress UspA family protein